MPFSLDQKLAADILEIAILPQFLLEVVLKAYIFTTS